ncbi:hypothetical protein O181_004102 [Austropuccinia psidii MF-1]|uniref:Integrase catalytic domain-containing protein n=1 Tax=Austropuccinia psidii MF-1 TaxID=1389203 RepID=A0A9Q3BG43_9BASI|nr:hypothetical protein [Austropuccinia psidii MF-1]
MFLPCHKDGTAMDRAIITWNKAISHIGLFQNIISDRDQNFTSALWTNIHNLFGTRLSFSRAYHPQTDGLAEKMKQTLEHIIRRFCAYGPESKGSDGFTHDWSILEKGWNPRAPYDTLKKDLVDINPTASTFKIILDKARNHAKRCMQDSFKYVKERWDKSNKRPESKVGDLVLVLTLNFNNIKGPKKLKDSLAGPFMIKALHGTNAVQLELTGEPMNKHPTFPLSLIKT